MIGTVGGLDLLSELERRARRPVDRELLGERRRRRKLELLQSASPRPGVLDYLRDARGLGLAVAIVSTDDTEWITRGLSILGLLDAWDFIECADGDVSRAKPSPALYVSALERLGIAPSEALAIEDSPNGIRAVKRARIFTLAVPNKITRFLDTSEANRFHIRTPKPASLFRNRDFSAPRQVPTAMSTFLGNIPARRRRARSTLRDRGTVDGRGALARCLG